MMMCIRFNLVFIIQERGTSVCPKDEGHVCVNFVVEKKDSSKTMVRNKEHTNIDVKTGLQGIYSVSH